MPLHNPGRWMSLPPKQTEYTLGRLSAGSLSILQIPEMLVLRVPVQRPNQDFSQWLHDVAAGGLKHQHLLTCASTGWIPARMEEEVANTPRMGMMRWMG